MSTLSELTVQPLKQLDKALNGLREVGLLPDNTPEEAPVVALIDKISDIDPDRAVAIARTLSQASLFNEVVREQISAMKIGQRYKDITEAFDSIRNDAKNMVDQVEDGEIDTMERLSNMWMKATRGDIPARFNKIKATYLEVTTDAKDQLQREDIILDSYQDFRGALKQSQVEAFNILNQAETRLKDAKAVLQQASDAVSTATTNAQTDDASTLSPEVREQLAKLELARDVHIRKVQDADERYQIAKDLAENLSISYNTSEVVMGRLKQITDAKQRVYSQSVAFFGTNETVFTALSASFTGLHGLHEATETLNAMKDGINKSLETLGDIGNQVQEEALRAGYGPNIRAESVKKLVDSIVAYQEKSQHIIHEMRELSSKNEEEIKQVVEDGKQRLVALQHRAAALPVPERKPRQSS